MGEAPERIWATPNYSWEEERVWKDAVEYVRADLSTLTGAVQAMKEMLEHIESRNERIEELEREVHRLTMLNQGRDENGKVLPGRPFLQREDGTMS